MSNVFHHLNKTTAQWLYLGFLITFACTTQAYTVEDGRITDDSGAVIHLKGVSWYGAEVGSHLVPSGLHKRNYKDLITEIKDLGFNAIRLPFCPRTLSAPAVPNDFSWVDKKINPGLYNRDGSGKTPFSIFQKIATELDRQGFYIVVDHHLIDCDDVSPVSVAISPLWYSDNYSESEWLSDLSEMVGGLKHLPGLLGVDLKNEPHNTATWGEKNPKTDWNAAAARAAEHLLKLAPDLLMFVQGISENANCGGDDYPHWYSSWGGNLARQLCMPLDIPASKLVLSPHLYGPTETVGGNNVPRLFTTNARSPRGNEGTPDDMKRALPEVWDQMFGRLSQAENGNHAIAVGEFGIRYGRFIIATDDPQIGISDSDSGAEKKRKRENFLPNRIRDKPWVDALLGYLTEKGITDSFWWAINGDGITGGIYYGSGLPRPDGTVHASDQWMRTRADIVSADPKNPGVLNRFWAKAACNDGIDNDRDGFTDDKDPDCSGLYDTTTKASAASQ